MRSQSPLWEREKIIEIEGGATLTFHGNGQNGRMITNFLKLVVSEVPPAPQRFNGQFIQLTVTDVVEAKQPRFGLEDMLSRY